MKDSKLKNQLFEWERSTNLLATAFIEKYYPDYIDDWYWIGDEIGDILIISDVFLNVDHMVDALRYDATLDQWHDWYWSYEDAENPEDMYRPMNLKDFVLYYNGFKK